MREEGFNSILAELPAFQEKLKSIREIILANLSMISEIPSPTFAEGKRIEFILQRFSEEGLDNSSTDQAGNAVGMLGGEEDVRKAEERDYILLMAHADTAFPAEIDHSVTIKTDRVIGPGVAENGLGLAALVSLPRIIKLLDLSLRSKVVLIATTQCMGRGNLQAIRFFLKNFPYAIRAGVCLEGVQLGRLNFASIGMLRGEIKINVPKEYDWSQIGAKGAIIVLNEIINRILAIPLPRKPATALNIGAIEGGASFEGVAGTASLRFEVQSESRQMVDRVEEEIRNIVDEMTHRTKARIIFDVIIRRRPGGIKFAHPLIKRTRAVMRKLSISPSITPSTSELSGFIDRKIPAITLGISSGFNIYQPKETIYINPIFKGLTQLVGVLLAIDGGYCDETRAMVKK